MLRTRLRSPAICLLLALSAHVTAENAVASPSRAGGLHIVQLRTEYRHNPLGLGVAKPRLSWLLRSDERGKLQSAYQIRVAVGEAALNGATTLLWDSGRISSDDSTQVTYEGPPLKSREQYYWQVRVWDENGIISKWSKPASWETGLLETSQWTAEWVEPKPAVEHGAMLRRSFRVRDKVMRARVYVTSHGLYQLFINGQRVGDAELTPGWTNYHKRLQYQAYDVTAHMIEGNNAVGALLGGGWYTGEIGFPGSRRLYGDRSALLLQLEVFYIDGTSDRIVTDSSWKSSLGPILMSDLYAGETYDARLEQRGWSEPGFDDATWSDVTVASAPKHVLVAQNGPPVRKFEEITPKRIMSGPKGKVLVDMGQNMVGWIRLVVQGPRGQTVTLRHGEVLDSAGNLYTANLRGAAQTVRYTLRGEGVEVYEPHFTYQGFRYVEIDGYPGELDTRDITGVAIYSDMEPFSELETSDPMINRLQQNIIRSQKGNFIEVPTDCPQRDERLGWTGDTQVFASTAALNANVALFFTKWMKDLTTDQYANGSFPFIAPDVLRYGRVGWIKQLEGKPAGGSAGWDDAATIVSWAMYLAYGDRGLLEEHYENMSRWLNFVHARAGTDLIWNDDFHWGDHPWSPIDQSTATWFEITNKDLIATAYFAHSTNLMSRIAHVIGKEQDARRYQHLSTNIRRAFQRTFVTDTGRVGDGTQTAYVLALDFDLLPESLRPLAAQKLVEVVRTRGHLTTGFLGTAQLLNVLSRFGYLEDAYRLLNRREYPSWLYPITHGATTMWEHWDGIRPDSSFRDADSNSFNHNVSGAVGQWMYRVMGGIESDPSAPGYKHSLIQPMPGGGITHVRASIHTLFGRLSSSWKLHNGQFLLEVEIPPNTSATIRLPHANAQQVRERQHLLRNALQIESHRQEGNSTIVQIGSGEYQFSYPWKQE